MTKKQVITKPKLGEVSMNKTTLFLLPAINLSAEKTGYRLLKFFGFVNCYIKHQEDELGEPEYLYLVFNPGDQALKRFREFYEVYKTYSNFVKDYILDYNLIVVVFKVKDKWRSTYEAFKESKYSKMSHEYAELFKRVKSTGEVIATNEYFIIKHADEYKKHLEQELDVIIPNNLELMDFLDPGKENFSYPRNVERYEDNRVGS